MTAVAMRWRVTPGTVSGNVARSPAAEPKLIALGVLPDWR
jgi:hypothetical protein